MFNEPTPGKKDAMNQTQTLTMDVRRNRARRLNLNGEAVYAFLDTRDPIDDRRLKRPSWWANRRRHQAIYGAARAQGDSPQRATHLANVAVERSLSVATALDGRTAWR